VNVWVALTWEGHIHHVAARTWFQGADPEIRIAFCRLTQISLLRLLTTRAVMGPDVMSLTEAWSAYDYWMRDERILFLEEPANIEPAFRLFSRRPRVHSKIWADAYLAAFATVEEMELVTFDREFEGKVDKLRILTP
jgi:uncharacterized protein